MMTFCPQIFRFLVLANEVSVTRFHFYTLRLLHGYASTRILSEANDTPTPFLFFYTQSVTRRVLEKRQENLFPFLTL